MVSKLEERLRAIEVRLDKIEKRLSEINIRTSGLQFIGDAKSYHDEVYTQLLADGLNESA